MLYCLPRQVNTSLPAARAAAKVLSKSLAAADNFEIEIIGKGSHGAMPSKSVDPIVCGASLIQNLQHIVSRNSDPKETLVITNYNSSRIICYNFFP